MATPKQTTSHVQRERESGKTAHKRNIHTNCTKKTKITVSKTNNMSTYIKIKKERLYRRERKRVLFV